MIVTCQNCEANFSLNDDLVKKTGSKVRCSKCKHVFVIYPKEAPEIEMLATDAGSERPPVPKAFSDQAVTSSTDSKARFGDTLDGDSFLGGDLDLSEVERMLATDGQEALDDLIATGKPELQEEAKAKPSEGRPSVAPAVGLDLSEIEQMLEMDQAVDDIGNAQETEPDDLVFDLGDSSVRPNTQKEFGDFDIADIEKMLEVEMVDGETEEAGGLLYQPTAPSSTPPPAAEKAPEVEEPFDFSEIDEMMETDTTAKADVDTGDKEDRLVLEMDDDFKPDAPAVDSKSGKVIEELDFSDLEGMIKADAAADAEKAADADEEEELTLALDSDDRFETPSAESKTMQESDLADLSKLNALLEEKEEAPADDEVSLELDLAEIAPAPSAAKADDELDLQFDETDADNEAVAEVASVSDSGHPMATEELDLEFDESQLNEELAEAADSASSAEEKTEEAETDAVAADIADKQPEQAKSNKKTLVLVLIAVLAIGVAGAAFLFDGFGIFGKNGIGIPFITKSQKPEISDVGNLKITAIDINSRFIENSAVGRLFVISGKARNGYDASRSFIRITGKLFTKGKQLVSTETVFCGNVIAGPDLSKLSLEDIKNRLGNRQGENDTNTNIKPGEDRPFMVVFSKLTENLEEFTIEVAGSEPAAK